MSDGNGTKLEFSGLVEKIQSIHQELKSSALRSVNTMLTLRNWLIGYYITNYELQGADRSQYGERLMDSISLELHRLKVPRSTKRELQRFCQFYRTYPQIVRSLNAQLGNAPWNEINPDLPAIAETSELTQKVRSVNAQSVQLSNRLLHNLSYAHFEILITLDDDHKRTFYELECLKANWSVRELRRQVHSLYNERSSLSKDKVKLAEHAITDSESFDPVLTIRDPYVF